MIWTFAQAVELEEFDNSEPGMFFGMFIGMSIGMSICAWLVVPKRRRTNSIAVENAEHERRKMAIVECTVAQPVLGSIEEVIIGKSQENFLIEIKQYSCKELYKEKGRPQT
jgi:hypothetical protein